MFEGFLPLRRPPRLSSARRWLSWGLATPHGEIPAQAAHGLQRHKCAAILRKTRVQLYRLNRKWQVFPWGQFSNIISLRRKRKCRPVSCSSSLNNPNNPPPPAPIPPSPADFAPLGSLPASTFQSSSYSLSSPSVSCPRLFPCHSALDSDISCRSDLLPTCYPVCSYPHRGNGKQPCRSSSVFNELKDPFTQKILTRDYRNRVTPLHNASPLPKRCKDGTADLPVTFSNSAQVCGKY